MRTPLPLLILLTLFLACNLPDTPPSVVIHTDDIGRYWLAFDTIRATEDTSEQQQLLREIYLDPASPGLKRLMLERNYSPDEYLDNIRRYPEFWKSIRMATQNTDELEAIVAASLADIERSYPSQKPAAIYFSIGAFRSGGTAVDSFVLIGAEFSLADSTADLSEFNMEQQEWMTPFYAKSPRDQLNGLIAHEYIHTQQQPIPEYLYGQSLYEGVAEFVSCLATGETADQSVLFGQANRDSVREIFEQEMFIDWNRRKWLWSNAPNPFGQRDLGYYIGYAISEQLYENAEDKSGMIERLIELDYSDTTGIHAIINESGFFSAPIDSLKLAIESKRPVVTGVERSGRQFTVRFSQPMDVDSRNFEFGPGGAEASLRVASIQGYSDDGKAFTFTVEDFPASQRRELVLGPRFFSATPGLPLWPYLIEVE